MRNIMMVFGATFFALIIFTGCGGGDSEENFTLPDPPKDLKYEGVTLIDGPLAECVQVVPGSYLLEIVKDEEFQGYTEKMKVKFKFIKSFDVKTGSGYNSYGPSLKGQVLDGQGAPLEFEISANTDEDLAKYLKRGSGEEWLTLYVFGQGSISTEKEAIQLLENYKKGKKIRFNSEIIEEKFDNESSSSESTESFDAEGDEASASSGDCDEFLIGYENFMVEYVAIVKKMSKNPNDMSAMTNYSSVMSKASEWAAKTADCAADAKFAAKFTAIQMKIANAASGM